MDRTPPINSVELSPADPPPRITPRNHSELSTKREVQERTPVFHPAPKIVRSAPQMRNIFSAKKKDRMPRLVTLKGLLPLESSYYDRQNKEETFFEQAFHIISVIGTGSFGEVFSVQSREDSRQYAVKVSMTLLRHYSVKYREAESHMMIQPHKNIVRFIRAWVETDRLYIQTELCDQSLQQYCSVKHAIPEVEMWNIFIDLLLAVHHLHSNDIIHDDIKPDNIFLTKDMICKLGDFGLAVNLKDSIHVKSAEEGDAKYLAPEVLNAIPTKASDIFSLGVTLLEAVTDLALPTSGDEWHQIRDGRVPERFFVGVSMNLRNLISAMMEKNPKNRPTAEELLESPSIKEKLMGRAMYIQEMESRDMVSTLLSSFLIWCMAFLSVLYDQIGRCHVSIQSRPNKPRPQHTPLHTPTGPSRAYAQSITGSAIRRQAELDAMNNDEDDSPPIHRLNLELDDDEEEEAPIRRQKPLSKPAVESNKSPSRPRVVARRRLQPKEPKVTSVVFQDPQLITAEERTARYERMLANELILDENDMLNQVDERPPPQSCPPQLRRRLRDMRRLPVLDFTKLDGV